MLISTMILLYLPANHVHFVPFLVVLTQILEQYLVLGLYLAIAGILHHKVVTVALQDNIYITMTH